MVRQHALMESLSASLRGFLHQINGNLSRPHQKFLQDALIGLLRAGCPIVCQMARQLPNQRTTYPWRRGNWPSERQRRIAGRGWSSGGVR